MEKMKKPRRVLSLDFKLMVLTDYYESGKSRNFISRKYGIDPACINHWQKQYALEEKDLILSKELCQKLESMRKAKKQRDALSAPASREQELQAEINRLRRALEYSELRNEALNEVLKIGREQYGIDLLKKAGAKQ